MQELIKFNFVYSDDITKIKGFLDLIPTNSICINYIDISNKLTKNDYLQHEPSDVIISSYLLKSLNSSLVDLSVDSIYYVLSEFNERIINNIKKHVIQTSTKSIEFNLYYTKGIKLKNLHSFKNKIIF